MFKPYNEIKTAIQSVAKGMTVVVTKPTHHIKLLTTTQSDSAIIALTDKNVYHVSEGDILTESTTRICGHYEIDDIDQLQTTKHYVYTGGIFVPQLNVDGPTHHIKPDHTLCRIASTIMCKQLGVDAARTFPQVPLFHVKFHQGDDSFLFNMESKVLHIRIKDETAQFVLCDGIKVTRTETGVPQLMVDLKCLGVSNKLIKLLS